MNFSPFYCHQIYSLLSDCKENFKKYNKNAFKITHPLQCNLLYMLKSCSCLCYKYRMHCSPMQHYHKLSTADCEDVTQSDWVTWESVWVYGLLFITEITASMLLSSCACWHKKWHNDHVFKASSCIKHCQLCRDVWWIITVILVHTERESRLTGLSM